jgi:hypothetical protein
VTTLADRSGPGVRITLLANERAPSGEPLDLDGRIISFTFAGVYRTVIRWRARPPATCCQPSVSVDDGEKAVDSPTEPD